jgi:hypothetical protein
VRTDGHLPECRWHKTTPKECEYRDTHNYCPHLEHACDCPPLPDPHERAREIVHSVIREHGMHASVPVEFVIDLISKVEKAITS